MDYALTKKVDVSYEEAEVRITEELKKEGFGVLTRIDVKETLKKKLDVDFNKYCILGACNPSFAHKALLTQEDIGLLLPCNVIVYENKDGETVVAIANPESMLSVIPNPEMNQFAVQVTEKLKRALDNV